ncbi:MAG: hypothetical protein J3Q66DRAFT_444609 [Benniella sp.]|nr:MAG: hypothetical protein J3Q66DRAFT_444609 [Benniella sp.]
MLMVLMTLKEIKKMKRAESQQLEGAVLKKIGGFKTTLIDLLGYYSGSGKQAMQAMSEKQLIPSFVHPVLKGVFKYVKGNPRAEVWDKLCPIQCARLWFPDRPDILVMKKFKNTKRSIPVLHGEVKTLSASNNAIAWDLLRLARFGRTSLAWGHSMACLIQVVHKIGTNRRIQEEDGLFVLRRVGTFELAFGLDDLPKSVGNPGVLLKARKDVYHVIKNGHTPCSHNLQDIAIKLGSLGIFLHAKDESKDEVSKDEGEVAEYEDQDDDKRHFLVLLDSLSYNDWNQFVTGFPGMACDFSDAERVGFERALRSKYRLEDIDDIGLERFYRCCEVHFRRSLLRVATNGAITDPDRGKVFYSTGLTLLDVQTEASFYKIVHGILEEFPGVERWINWHLHLSRGKLIFPALSTIDNSSLSSDTNVQESLGNDFKRTAPECPLDIPGTVDHAYRYTMLIECDYKLAMEGLKLRYGDRKVRKKRYVNDGRAPDTSKSVQGPARGKSRQNYNSEDRKADISDTWNCCGASINHGLRAIE